MAKATKKDPREDLSYRLMACLIVDVNVGPLDAGKPLQFDLEIFCDVMHDFKPLVSVDDNVDFNDETRTAVVGTYGIDTFDQRRMGHSY